MVVGGITYVTETNETAMSSSVFFDARTRTEFV